MGQLRRREEPNLSRHRHRMRLHGCDGESKCQKFNHQLNSQYVNPVNSGLRCSIEGQFMENWCWALGQNWILTTDDGIVFTDHQMQIKCSISLLAENCIPFSGRYQWPGVMCISQSEFTRCSSRFEIHLMSLLFQSSRSMIWFEPFNNLAVRHSTIPQ